MALYELLSLEIIREIIHRSVLSMEDRDENIIVVSIESARDYRIWKASDGLGAIVDPANFIKILDKVKFLAFLVEY